jgi:transposase
MARPILDDGLWEIIEPILPPPKKRRFRYPGRRPIDNRKALTGILFVLRTGIQWEHLPQEMGCGCGMTCWRRLRDWQKAGVWEQLHKILLDLLNEAGRIDWQRAVVDSSSVRAVFGGRKPAPIRRIAARPAASITSSPTAKASRFPARSPARTPTMSLR